MSSTPTPPPTTTPPPRRRGGDGGGRLDALHRGIARLLSTRHGEPAFVGCLHEIALSERASDLAWLPPSAVAASARHSGSLHSGILILERQILAGGGGGGEGGDARGGGKRARTAPAERRRRRDGAAAAGGAWMALAELYRDVGDEDIVRGISGQLTRSAELRAALAAEARGDAEEALQWYRAAAGEADGGGGGSGSGGRGGGGQPGSVRSRGAARCRRARCSPNGTSSATPPGS